MKQKEHGRLVKALVAGNAPSVLYAEPRVWMEGADLEGFGANFSFGFVKTPQVLHPVSGQIVHPYDECLVFAGTDSSNILHLGAEVSIRLGIEQEEHVFDRPSVALIPKGTPHGPVIVRRVDRPIVHFHIGLSAEYQASPVRTITSPASRGHEYDRLVQPVLTHPESRPKPGKGGMGYESVLGQDGIMRPAEGGVGPGNGDQIVWMYGKDLHSFPLNFIWGFYSRCGKWHRRGEVHVHPEAEALCFVGLDPDRLDYLGAELEIGMGKDSERHVFNKPTVAICPGGFPHLPIITRWVDNPYGFIAISLNGEHDSPWVEA
jgi:hypothetical protein